MASRTPPRLHATPSRAQPSPAEPLGGASVGPRWGVGWGWIGADSPHAELDAEWIGRRQRRPWAIERRRGREESDRFIGAQLTRRRPGVIRFIRRLIEPPLMGSRC